MRCAPSQRRYECKISSLPACFFQPTRDERVLHAAATKLGERSRTEESNDAEVPDAHRCSRAATCSVDRREIATAAFRGRECFANLAKRCFVDSLGGKASRADASPGGNFVSSDAVDFDRGIGGNRRNRIDSLHEDILELEELVAA